MKRKKFFSFIAVVAMLCVVTVAVLPKPSSAADLTNMSDTMSRLEVSVVDVTHDIVFTPTTAINLDDGVQITITSAFGDASLDVADYSIVQAAGGTACAAWTEVVYVPANDVIQFECDTVAAAGTGAITVAITTDLDNPAATGEQELLVQTYDLGADTNFGGADDVLEDNGDISVTIIDDDTVNITGYIDTVLTFDLDTTETDEDCDASGGVAPCDSHGGSTDDAGYVVDLGELTLTTVSDSGDTVSHADGLSGVINYVWFDFTTNADGGVAVTVVAANTNDIDGTPDAGLSSLDGPTGSEIRSVDCTGGGTVEVVAGSGLYGMQESDDHVPTSTNSATITIDDNYDADTGHGMLPSPDGTGATGPETIFSTADPVDDGRASFEVAVSPDASDGTGTYTDSLTFIATSTF